MSVYANYKAARSAADAPTKRLMTAARRRIRTAYYRAHMLCLIDVDPLQAGFEGGFEAGYKLACDAFRSGRLPAPIHAAAAAQIAKA